MKKIKIGIVEDERMVMDSLKFYLERQEDMEIVNAAHTVEDFIRQQSQHNSKIPDLILLDIGLPQGMSGLEGIRYLQEALPKAEIVMYTASDDSEKIFKALCAGAVAYISKETSLMKVKEALLDVYRGGAFMSPFIARKIIKHFRPQEKQNEGPLTPRQQQIVEALIEGLSYKQVADRLLITVDTVRDHIKKIYRALHINSRSELLAKRVKNEI